MKLFIFGEDGLLFYSKICEALTYLSEVPSKTLTGSHNYVGTKIFLGLPKTGTCSCVQCLVIDVYNLW